MFIIIAILWTFCGYADSSIQFEITKEKNAQEGFIYVCRKSNIYRLMEGEQGQIYVTVPESVTNGFCYNPNTGDMFVNIFEPTPYDSSYNNTSKYIQARIQNVNSTMGTYWKCKFEIKHHYPLYCTFKVHVKRLKGPVITINGITINTSRSDVYVPEHDFFGFYYSGDQNTVKVTCSVDDKQGLRIGYFDKYTQRDPYQASNVYQQTKTIGEIVKIKREANSNTYVECIHQMSEDLAVVRIFLLKSNQGNPNNQLTTPSYRSPPALGLPSQPESKINESQNVNKRTNARANFNNRDNPNNQLTTPSYRSPPALGYPSQPGSKINKSQTVNKHTNARNNSNNRDNPNSGGTTPKLQSNPHTTQQHAAQPQSKIHNPHQNSSIDTSSNGNADKLELSIIISLACVIFAIIVTVVYMLCKKYKRKDDKAHLYVNLSKNGCSVRPIPSDEYAEVLEEKDNDSDAYAVIYNKTDCLYTVPVPKRQRNKNTPEYSNIHGKNYTDHGGLQQEDEIIADIEDPIVYAKVMPKSENENSSKKYANICNSDRYVNTDANEYAEPAYCQAVIKD